MRHDQEPTFDSDRIGEFPHPRETARLVGHGEAERQLLDAIHSDKLAHAWLFAGPPGIGKATLAYRVARYLLRYGSGSAIPRRDSLDVDADDPVARRVAALSHGSLLVLRRLWEPTKKKPKTELTVDEVRKVQNFFALSAGEGGWRVCIIDCADDMNRFAANALLKTLEEPPAKSILIAVSHTPGRLLPTIRSRCRRLNLKPLSDDEVRAIVKDCLPKLSRAKLDRLIALAAGSPGRALTLAHRDAAGLYDDIVAILQGLPTLSERDVLKLAERLSRSGEDRTHLLALDLMADWVLHAGLGAVDGERGAAMHWAEAWQDLQRLKTVADALNLDAKQTVHQALHRLEEAAGQREKSLRL